MGVPAFHPELAVERSDEAIVRRLARSREVGRHAALIRPRVKIATDELAALIGSGSSPGGRSRRRSARASPQGPHPESSAVVRPRARSASEKGEREAQEGVDDGQHADLPIGCARIVDKFIASNPWPRSLVARIARVARRFVPRAYALRGASPGHAGSAPCCVAMGLLRGKAGRPASGSPANPGGATAQDCADSRSGLAARQSCGGVAAEAPDRHDGSCRARSTSVSAAPSMPVGSKPAASPVRHPRPVVGDRASSFANDRVLQHRPPRFRFSATRLVFSNLPRSKKRRPDIFVPETRRIA